MNKLQPFPVVSKELLEALEKRFPDRAPYKGDDYPDIMYRAGEVAVVRFLRYQFDLQNQNILEN
jgi:hypothetical protein